MREGKEFERAFGVPFGERRALAQQGWSWQVVVVSI